MKYFALVYVVAGVKTAREIFAEFVTVDGVDVPLVDRHHSSIVVQLVEVPEGTVSGATYDEVTELWTNPDPVAAMDGDTGNGNPPPDPE